MLLAKKILFIGPIFFGYERDIEREIRRQGAEVDFLPDRPFSAPFLKAVTRFCRILVLPFADRFFSKSVEEFGRSHYDFIFVVQGECLTPKSLSSLRIKFPKAKFVLYLWDSLENKKLLIKNISEFDICYTFDPVDSFTYGINFMPLFYSHGFKSTISTPLKYKLSFIGTAHSDRYSIVSRLTLAVPDEKLFYRYLYLQAPWVYWVNKFSSKFFKDASLKDFHYRPMTKQNVQNIFSQSLAILDIEHPRQRGLTMRTFEALGAGKKLITTNEHIKDADFYNSNNIHVIHRRETLNIPSSFLNTEYTPLENNIYEKYSLQSWIKQIFDNI